MKSFKVRSEKHDNTHIYVYNDNKGELNSPFLNYDTKTLCTLRLNICYSNKTTQGWGCSSIGRVLV